MPGDDVLKRYIESFDSPWFLLVIGILIIIAYVVVKTIPMVKELRLKKIDADTEIKRLSIEQENAREKRKAEEFQQQMKLDKERTEVIGKQNEILEHLATSHDNEAIQMSSLISSLDESKLRSREMGETIKDMHGMVSEIHTVIVKANK